MSETETIQVMGRGANVDFTIDDTVPYEVAVQGLRSYLSECNGLYSRGTVSVNVGRRILEAAELSGIKRILDQESGLTVSRYWCAPEIIEEALHHPQSAAVADPDPEETLAPEDGSPPGRRPANADSADSNVPAAAESESEPAEPPPVATAAAPETGPAEPPQSPPPDEPAAEPAEMAKETAAVPAPAAPAETAVDGKAAEQPTAEESIAPEKTEAAPEPPAGLPTEEMALNPRRRTEALVLKTTCRSGEVIRYPGDVVALADVNPGAEIIADGDIVVFGALRGLAHAGAAGDLKATIIALNLESPRVQIGPHIGEAPRSTRHNKVSSAAPQVAYVRRRSIFVAPFTRRQDEYQGGILYEG